MRYACFVLESKRDTFLSVLCTRGGGGRAARFVFYYIIFTPRTTFFALCPLNGVSGFYVVTRQVMKINQGHS